MSSNGNWGRWGPDDEAGALNLITAGTVRRALDEVEEGRVVVLGQALGPETVIPKHRKRVERLMLRDGGDYAAGARRPGGFQFAEDVVSFAAHSGTHIDALAHVWYDDQLYNGYPSTTVRSTSGAQRCGAEQLRPIITRGILLDVAGLPDIRLEPGDAITHDHLEAAAEFCEVTPEPGDAVLIRTGWLGATAHDSDKYLSGEPGIDSSAAKWLARADVAVVGADNFAIEVMPFRGQTCFPVHQLLLRDYGVPMIEGMVLDALAELASGPFLFVGVPIPLIGSTAGPVCPVAVL